MSFLQEYRNRPRRVVFYGRVSTEHEAQVSALDNQMDWYQELAAKNPNWEVVGQYVDEGITGTQATKRPSFMQMIEDAESGKFDLVVTREVCRFARNTMDTLFYTRKLSKLGVMFFVIDSRYRSRRPMVITTNLKLAELKNPPDLAHARIYDRILERCAPILFDGKNFREENAGATKQVAKDIVNRKHD